MQVIRGYNAACLMADLHTKTAPSADKVVDRFRHIDWEDATEEQRKKLLWVNNCGHKSAHLPLTPQEKEQIRLNTIFHYEEMYKYLYKNYGYEYAERFYEDKQLTCKKIKAPLCNTKQEKGQCNLFCPYFNKGCTLQRGLRKELFIIEN